MKKNKIISVLATTFLIAGILSTSSITAKASEINKKNVTSITKVSKEFNLNPIKEVPKDAKILKFNTPEQVEKFLKIVQYNEKSGNTLNILSLMSDNELNNKIIDLSNKEITNKNFIKKDLIEKTPTHNRVRRSYNTSRAKYILINGIAKLNARCSMKIDWSSNKGNYISSIRSVTSSLTGLTIGNIWTQTDYDENISNDGQSVDVTIYGKYDYYILLNAGLTSWSGATQEYNFTFEY